MKSLPLKKIVQEIGGKILSGTDSVTINNVVIGIKNIKQYSLVFDVNREKYVRHMIYAKNSPCAIVTDKPENYTKSFENITIIEVSSIKAACLRFISFYRKLFDIPVIGVTGTCGKTTTKEMIKHILSQKYKVNATFKSYNAQFRHINYLMEIDDSTQAAVIEMGVAAKGDLKLACRYFKPQTGVITNIGIDHLNAFGTLDAYIKGKAEFLEGLDYKGTLILNADDENIKKIDLSDYKGNIIYFGKNKSADFKISNIMQNEGGIEFSLLYKNEFREIHVPVNGEFNAYNATAAIAAVLNLGFDLKEAIDALVTFQNVERHFEIKQGLNSSILIDDTWSTNPTSAEAALKHLKALSNGKKAIAVLGKMLLLGKQSEYHHKKIGEKVVEMGIDELVLIGDGAKEIGFGAIQSGMDTQNVHFCKSSDETIEVLQKLLNKNTIVLVKTSMMESFKKLIERLLKPAIM
jgi:UDP-N-acetylmuramoyl-tripeptide--D-alanyl-D-alanine ligase